MDNFVFQNPTKIIFGEGSIGKISKEVVLYKKILVTFGGGSAKKNGVYNQVVNALKDVSFVEFWGIEPNPKVETLRKAIALGRQEQVDFVLAVGGGSVLDGSKLIAAGILSHDDAWDLVLDNSKVGAILPFAGVITLPATGSEMNNGAVISCLASQEKHAFHADYPRFSVLDPTTTFTLPTYQRACGIADSFIHVLEQYLVDQTDAPLMDRWAEGILQTLIEIAPKVMQNGNDYQQMSNFMLSATMALNGFIAMGVKQDWATHFIGHEITAFTGITHGETLAIVGPALMDVMRNEKHKKLVQYARRVWNIKELDEQKTIDEAIAKTENFYRSLSLKTRLSEHQLGDDLITKIYHRFQERGTRLGENQNIDAALTKKILERAK